MDPKYQFGNSHLASIIIIVRFLKCSQLIWICESSHKSSCDTPN